MEHVGVFSELEFVFLLKVERKAFLKEREKDNNAMICEEGIYHSSGINMKGFLPLHA